MDRRKFLSIMGMAGAAAAIPWRARSLGQIIKPRPLFAQSQLLTKFIQPLPRVGVDIPVATANTTAFPGVDYYQIGQTEFTQQLHPELPKATKLWGYYDVTNPVQKHLGGVIIAQKNTPVRVTFTNTLPNIPLLPVDNTLPGAETGQNVNRTAIHLHGGFVFWTSDGGPFHWFSADGTHGPDYFGTDYWYPNEQSARFMWYHDHAVGITRLNAYAGLATGYVITDPNEAALVAANQLPAGDRTLYLIFQDKLFKTEFDQWGAPGDLHYPYLYDTARWEWGGVGTPPVPSAIPEMFGDNVLVNGVASPYIDVTADVYRLRILNACNSRFLRCRLFKAKGATPPLSTEADLAVPGPTFRHIANEGGWILNKSGVVESRFLMGPAERVDLLVDFTGAAVGDIFILYNNAGSPFPNGDPLNDYRLGNKMVAPFVASGFTPDTRNILQFRVVGATAVGALNPLTTPGPEPQLPFRYDTMAVRAGVTVAQTRVLTLNEDFDDYGRLIARVGTNTSLYPGTFARNYLDFPTETPVAGSWEIWEVYNLTGDTHPMHFHLVNCQVMNRQNFDVAAFMADPLNPVFTGVEIKPPAYERGWKETIRMNPGQVTRIIMKFDLPTIADPQFPTGQPVSPRLQAAYGINGAEYVLHCHILDHEEHDMMRPLVVV